MQRRFRITKRFVDRFGYIFLPQELEIVEDHYMGSSTHISSGVRYPIKFRLDEIAPICDDPDSWLEEIKPERWRAKKDCSYWYVGFKNALVYPMHAIEGDYDEFDSIRYDEGNYFATEKQAEQAESAAAKVKELLLSLGEEV